MGDTLPPDATGSIDLDANDGKVALVSSSTLLEGSCPARSDIVDFVGYGSADCRRGPTLAPELAITSLAFRLAAGCTDSDNNGADFIRIFPLFQWKFGPKYHHKNSSSDVNPCNQGNIDFFDNQKDIGVWRSTSGQWSLKYSAHGNVLSVAVNWGTTGDQPVAGDYDGDGYMDLAVWRPSNGTWFILTSASNYTTYLSFPWGSEALNDQPVPADYDGDGRTDVAMWRPETGEWWILQLSTGFSTYVTEQWGAGALGDVPVTADYDGDLRRTSPCGDRAPAIGGSCCPRRITPAI